MEINSEVAQQVLDELFPVFEALEAQSTAILRFMKEKGIATDQDIAPYLEQAGDASNVKWRAARLRIGRLFSLAGKVADQESETRKEVKEIASQEPEGQSPDRAQQVERGGQEQPEPADAEQKEIVAAAKGKEKSAEGLEKTEAAVRPEQAETKKAPQENQGQSATPQAMQATNDGGQREMASPEGKTPNEPKEEQAKEEADGKGARQTAKAGDNVSSQTKAAVPSAPIAKRGRREAMRANDDREMTTTQTKAKPPKKKDAA
jgi:hypothetical protein